MPPQPILPKLTVKLTMCIAIVLLIVVFITSYDKSDYICRGSGCDVGEPLPVQPKNTKYLRWFYS